MSKCNHLLNLLLLSTVSQIGLLYVLSVSSTPSSSWNIILCHWLQFFKLWYNVMHFTIQIKLILICFIPLQGVQMSRQWLSVYGFGFRLWHSFKKKKKKAHYKCSKTAVLHLRNIEKAVHFFHHITLKGSCMYLSPAAGWWTPFSFL